MKNFVFLLLFCCLSTALSAQNWEVRYLQRQEAIRRPGTTTLMRGLSKTSPPLCLATPVGMFGTSLLTKDKQLRRASVTGGIGLALCIVETHALKKLIKRKRPYDAHPLALKPLGHETSWSMPSGHTSTAFYTATWLALEYPKWYVAIPAFLWAGTVSYSRNYLGVHYGTDVLAGAALGGATAWAVWRLRK